MSSINNPAVALRSALAYRWETFLRNLPFRMRIGLFGIWLMKVGRFLQVRYANWNRKFRLKYEFHPNQDRCTIHVSEQVTNDTILTFESPSWQPNKMTPMVRALFDIRGIASVVLCPYEITLGKARVYFWDELQPEVDRIIIEHLTAKQT